MATRQAVRQITGLPSREQVGLPPVGDVGATALDEVPGESLAHAPAFCLGGLADQSEIGVEQAEQIVKRLLVAGMRGRRKHDHVLRLFPVGGEVP